MVHVFSQKILSISETYACSWFMISIARAFVHVYVCFVGAEHVRACVRVFFRTGSPLLTFFPRLFLVFVVVVCLRCKTTRELSTGWCSVSQKS